jgi:DNA-directed RNA polymerase subunit M/transcription elongation factor TFIIS
MTIEQRCKTCGKILPTSNKLEEQVTVCTDCANVLAAATQAEFVSNKLEKRQDRPVQKLRMSEIVGL